MKVRREQNNRQRIVLEEIEPFFLDLLRGLPACADPGENPAARARLFSAPMARGGDGDEFNEDWERYVEPEIRELFRSAQETVAEDLATLPSAPSASPEVSQERDDFAPSGLTLEIPRRHAEAWLSVLNQARIIIAARRGFGEREMEESLPLPPFTDRDLDLFRIHFFDFIQQILLSDLGYE